MTDSAPPTLTSSQREHIYRRNFVYFLTDNTLFNVGLGIIGSTTVIPDFVRHLTSSEILIGLCGGLFTIGNTFPQLFIARYVVQHARKKPWFVIPNIPARFIVLFFALLTLW